MSSDEDYDDPDRIKGYDNESVPREVIGYIGSAPVSSTVTAAILFYSPINCLLRGAWGLRFL